MKKILLVRDYSGMASQMATALRAEGHNVTLASISDSFKGNYGCDINLEAPVLGMKLVDQYLNYIKLVARSGRYDIIHLQTQLLAGPYSLLLLPVLAMLRLKTRVLTLSLAGDDYRYWRQGPLEMRYSPHAESQRIDSAGKQPYYLSVPSRITCGFTETIADKLIPACYDYAVSHAPSSKLTRHVPFFFDVENTPFVQLTDATGRKIKIFHAVSRAGFKGSRFISAALEKCQSMFGDKVEISVLERIPYEEYKRHLSECDIFIDQCNSYSYGMAAVEALALGKIVLSGAEQDALLYMDATDCPVINIKPDALDIFENLQKIIESPKLLPKLSGEARAFAERFHSYNGAMVKLKQAWDLNA